MPLSKTLGVSYPGLMYWTVANVTYLVSTGDDSGDDSGDEDERREQQEEEDGDRPTSEFPVCCVTYTTNMPC